MGTCESASHPDVMTALERTKQQMQQALTEAQGTAGAAQAARTAWAAQATQQRERDFLRRSSHRVCTQPIWQNQTRSLKKTQSGHRPHSRF